MLQSVSLGGKNRMFEFFKNRRISALINAAYGRDYEEVRRLLDKGIDIIAFFK
jgi:hypothetical protein